MTIYFLFKLQNVQNIIKKLLFLLPILFTFPLYCMQQPEIPQINVGEGEEFSLQLPPIYHISHHYKIPDHDHRFLRYLCTHKRPLEIGSRAIVTEFSYQALQAGTTDLRIEVASKTADNKRIIEIFLKLIQYKIIIKKENG